MTLKQYIAKTILDLKALGTNGPVTFDLIVVPNLYKDTWEIEVIGTLSEKQAQIASTIKFTVDI